MSHNKLISNRLFSSFLLIWIIFLLLPSAAAANVQIEKQSSGETLIADFEKPVLFNLSITNLGNSDDFEIYNLVGFSMSPNEFSLDAGETKEIRLELAPIGEIEERGFYTITYFIKRVSTSDQMREKLTFKVIDLGEAFEIGSSDIDPEKSSAEIFIRNTLNVDFENINAEFSSPFFETKERFSLDAEETKTFEVRLEREDFRNLTAGFYTMKAEIETQGASGEAEDTIRFIEKDIVTTSSTDLGFIVNTKTIEKTNEGNVVQTIETEVEKNIISRLFTTFEPEPDLVEREGLKIYYTWIEEISPGQTLQILVKTNWLFPFLIILFVLAIVAMTRKYTSRELLLRKKVSFVKAKGGEFALKVSILVSPQSHVERVNVIDKLPPLVKIYERFGSEEPTRIDKKNKRIEWNLDNLEAGEKRILSYIIYSKVGVLGRFALPTATAIYEKDGEIRESESNRAFFVADQPEKKDDEEIN